MTAVKDLLLKPDENYRQMHIALGSALDYWAQLEANMAFWFCYSLNIEGTIGNSVMYSVESFKSRLEMSRAAAQGLQDNQTKGFYLRALAKAEKYMQARNILAHGIQVDGNHEGYAVFMPSKDVFVKKADKRLTVDDLHIAGHNFAKLSTCLSQKLVLLKQDKQFLRFTNEEIETLLEELPNNAFKLSAVEQEMLAGA